MICIIMSYKIPSTWYTVHIMDPYDVLAIFCYLSYLCQEMDTQCVYDLPWFNFCLGQTLPLNEGKFVSISKRILPVRFFLSKVLLTMLRKKGQIRAFFGGAWREKINQIGVCFTGEYIGGRGKITSCLISPCHRKHWHFPSRGTFLSIGWEVVFC